MVKLYLSRLTRRRVAKPRRRGGDYSLVFEPLERRTLLAANSLLGPDVWPAGEHESARVEMRQQDHHPRQTEPRGAAEHRIGKHHSQRRDARDGQHAHDHQRLLRDSRPPGPKTVIRLPSFAEQAPPPVADVAPPASALAPPIPLDVGEVRSPILLSRLTSPPTISPPIASPPIASPLNSGPIAATNDLEAVDLAVSSGGAGDPVRPPFVSETSSLAPRPARSGVVALSPSRSQTSPVAWDAVQDQAIAMMFAAEVKADDSAGVDWSVESSYGESSGGSASDEVLHVAFVAFSLNEVVDPERSESGQEQPFREGFVDIGEPIDHRSGDPADAAASVGGSAAAGDRQAASASSAGGAPSSLPMVEMRRLARTCDAQPAGGEDACADAGLSARTEPAEGMVELAHGPVLGLGIEVDGDSGRAVLKLDGSLARYQVFEFEPLPQLDAAVSGAPSGFQEPTRADQTAGDSSQSVVVRGASAPVLAYLLARSRASRRKRSMQANARESR